MITCPAIGSHGHATGFFLGLFGGLSFLRNFVVAATDRVKRSAAVPAQVQPLPSGCPASPFPDWRKCKAREGSEEYGPVPNFRILCLTLSGRAVLSLFLLLT